MQQAQAGLQDIQRGQSLADTWSNRGEQLTRVFETQSPLPGLDGREKNKPNALLKTPIKEPLNSYGISLVCGSQNAKSHSTAPGRRPVHFAVSNRRTIFGKSTMARYPLIHTSSRLLDPHSMIMKHFKQRRRLKGGTIFGKSERMRYPWMYPSACRENAKWLMTMARRQNAIKRKRR